MPASESPAAKIQEVRDGALAFRHDVTRLATEMGRVIVGHEEVIDGVITGLLAGGHVLLEGVPGLGKTLLVRTLAEAVDLVFARLQFTPDLMPADITGTNIFNLQRNEFTLVKGPVFTAFLLADEINRAPAKTQSALLQAMQERTVTIDRETHSLPANFTVFATQNPIESEGTYPLPEAQKDRFLMKITMLCPERDEELLLARRTLGQDAPETLLKRGEVRQIVSAEQLAVLRAELVKVVVQPELVAYAVDLVRATRTHESVLVGAGPRATQSLLLAARAQAALADRDFVTPDDLKALAVPVLEHRLVLRPEFEIEGASVKEVIERILQTVAVPR